MLALSQRSNGLARPRLALRRPTLPVRRPLCTRCSTRDPDPTEPPAPRAAKGAAAALTSAAASLLVAGAAHADSLVDLVDDVFDVASVAPDQTFELLPIERFGWMVVFPAMIIWMLVRFEKDAIARERLVQKKLNEQPAAASSRGGASAHTVHGANSMNMSDEMRRVVAQAATRRIIRQSRMVREACHMQLTRRLIEKTESQGKIEWDWVSTMLDSSVNPMSGATEDASAPTPPSGATANIEEVCNYVAGRAAEDAALQEIMLLINTVTQDDWVEIFNYIALEEAEEDEWQSASRQ